MFVKICGITRAEDALLAAELGASAIGFVFSEASPRHITPERAKTIVDRLPACVSTVGVFVDEDAAVIRRTASVAGLSAVQLHGRETPETAARLGLRVVKALSADDAARSALGSWPLSITILLDAADSGRRGGTGTRADWTVAREMARRRPLFLAGGLTAANVAQAIREVRPAGLDVSSGVECAPGVKDAAEMRRFFDAVRRESEGGLPEFGRRDPDARGYFGSFGGRFVPETLVAPVGELERAYLEARADPAFAVTLSGLLATYAGRPTPLSEASRLSSSAGGARIFLKREDLAHTGAHKINNALGQALLARRMGKTRIIAETGAGQHGVATATACALLGLRCEVYMGAEDMARQAPNLARMQWLGASVRRVDNGSRTLKDAINEAMRDWVANVDDTYYLLGSALGPHPYPLMVREFQSVIGAEARRQILARIGRLPDAVVASVGGGSNAIGIFDGFLDDAGVRLVGVEAGGDALLPGRHAARFAGGSPGVLQGTRTYILQDGDGNIEPTHSISAGLDYAAVGPEHAWLRDIGRTEYTLATDEEARQAFIELARLEGILPALESAHAVAGGRRMAAGLGRDAVVLVNLSGRGDKDMGTMMEADRDVAS